LESSPDAVNVDEELSDLETDLRIFSDEPRSAATVMVEMPSDDKKLHS
jgi:hypothetical protein